MRPSRAACSLRIQGSDDADRRPQGMFVRFTDRARRSYLAQEEARPPGHDYAAPSTSCSALLSEGEGVAAKALESLGTALEEARGRVEEITGWRQGSRNGHLPFTPPAKRALELSLRRSGGPRAHLHRHRACAAGPARQGRRRWRPGADRARRRPCPGPGTGTGLADRPVRSGRPPGGAAADLAATAEELDSGGGRRKPRSRQVTLTVQRHCATGNGRSASASWAAVEPAEQVAGTSAGGHRGESSGCTVKLDRLRGLLREHGIEPDGGTAQTA